MLRELHNLVLQLLHTGRRCQRGGKLCTDSKTTVPIISHIEQLLQFLQHVLHAGTNLRPSFLNIRLLLRHGTRFFLSKGSTKNKENKLERGDRHPKLHNGVQWPHTAPRGHSHQKEFMKRTRDEPGERKRRRKKERHLQ